MKLSEFDYHLPKECIAQYPLVERDSSRLMVIHKKHKKIEHCIFRDITEYFQRGDVLILNDTKVIPARIYGNKLTGGKVEILLIKEYRPNEWEVVVKGIKTGTVLLKNDISCRISRGNGTSTLTSDYDIKKILYTIGVMPLPPYIRRHADQSDSMRYQTVYAEKEGAIAAPTAGLHFTDKLLDEIKEKGIEVRKVTLHVGHGTFKPVSCPEIENHHMDEEYYEVPGHTAEAIDRAASEGRRIIAAGTTVTRALESSAYENYSSPIPLPDTSGAGARGRVKAATGKTSIFIYPGYKFKVIDALITNFHLPKSTPLMLTSAFSGAELLKKAYPEALSKGYRFFSYGDAMLII